MQVHEVGASVPRCRGSEEPALQRVTHINGSVSGNVTETVAELCKQREKGRGEEDPEKLPLDHPWTSQGGFWEVRQLNQILR